MSTVAFLGAGAMGSRMATTLLSAGHAVTIYNRTPAPLEALERVGATRAASPRAAAEAADVVISVVTDVEASRAVWTGDDGALAGLRAGAVAIESSTLTPGYVRNLAERVSTCGAAFLDAPVAGSRPQAEAGSLIYFVGGDAEALERVRPLLEVMGGAVHHVGPAGSGTAVKLAVNVLFGAQVALAAELLAYLRAEGVDSALAAETLGATPVASPAAKGAMGAIVARSFAPLFPVSLVAKDFRYAAEAASAAHASVPVTEAVKVVFEQSVSAGHGGDNITGVAQLQDFRS